MPTQSQFPSLAPLTRGPASDHSLHSPEGWLRQAAYWESRGAVAKADNCFHLALLAEGDRARATFTTLPKEPTHDQDPEQLPLPPS